MLIIKPMIWMPMTSDCDELTQPRLLSWRIFQGMAKMYSLRETIGKFGDVKAKTVDGNVILKMDAIVIPVLIEDI
ncbi:hypothetical protein Tco_1409208 [Tanacetum coccineum]